MSGRCSSRASAPPSATARGRQERSRAAAAPHKSAAPKLRRSGRSTSTAQPASIATTIPGGTLIRNSQCQENRSVTNPPMLGPKVGASIANSPATNVARDRPGQSNIRKIAENTSGISAPPQKPWTTRAEIKDQNPVDPAQARLAAVKPPAQTTKAPRVDNIRVSQPSAGSRRSRPSDRRSAPS